MRVNSLDSLTAGRSSSVQGGQLSTSSDRTTNLRSLVERTRDRLGVAIDDG